MLIVLYIIVYPVLILYVCLSLNYGIYNWLVVAAFLAPEVILTVRHYEKLIKRRILQMMTTPKEWNVDQALGKCDFLKRHTDEEEANA